MVTTVFFPSWRKVSGLNFSGGNIVYRSVQVSIWSGYLHHEGAFYAAANSTIPFSSNPLTAESCALLEAVHWVISLNLNNVQFEIDGKQLFDKLSKP